MAHVFRRDRALARLTAAHIRMHGPSGHAPSGWFFVFVLLDQSLNFVRVQVLRRRSQDVAVESNRTGDCSFVVGHTTCLMVPPGAYAPGSPDVLELHRVTE